MRRAARNTASEWCSYSSANPASGVVEVIGIGNSSICVLAMGTPSALPTLTHEEADYYMVCGIIAARDILRAFPEDNMNEQQNLDIVGQGYAAFGRGDIQGLLDLLDPQVTWTTPGGADVPMAGTRRGHAAVGEFFATLTSTLEITRF